MAFQPSPATYGTSWSPRRVIVGTSMTPDGAWNARGVVSPSMNGTTQFALR